MFIKFWEYLNSHICNQNNDVYVKLELETYFNEQEHEELVEVIKEYKFQINSLKMQLYEWIAEMQCRTTMGVIDDLEHVFVCGGGYTKGIASLEKFVQQLSKLVCIAIKKEEKHEKVAKEKDGEADDPKCKNVIIDKIENKNGVEINKDKQKAIVAIPNENNKTKMKKEKEKKQEKENETGKDRDDNLETGYNFMPALKFLQLIMQYLNQKFHVQAILFYN